MSERMTVGEMLKHLSKLPADAPLFTNGYEGGYCDAEEPKEVNLVLNVNQEWYHGPHDDADFGPAKGKSPAVKGYLIG